MDKWTAIISAVERRPVSPSRDMGKTRRAWSGVSSKTGDFAAVDGAVIAGKSQAAYAKSARDAYDTVRLGLVIARVEGTEMGTDMLFKQRFHQRRAPLASARAGMPRPLERAMAWKNSSPGPPGNPKI
jgi:hypothetical protein